MSIPQRIKPYRSLDRIDQDVPLVTGRFDLVANDSLELDGELAFQWRPSIALGFSGQATERKHVDLNNDWILKWAGSEPFNSEAVLLGVELSSNSTRVRGVLRSGFSLGQGPFEALRFCLCNFPSYLGNPIRYTDQENEGTYAGRMVVGSEWGELRVDAIRDAKALSDEANRSGGYVISHVGQWIPANGTMSTEEAEDLIKLLHFWFAFLRGSWAGPVFPEGMVQDQPIWWQYASWKLREGGSVPVWFPTHKKLDLDAAFSRFVELWQDTKWKEPLASAISWFVTANQSRQDLETRIILAQVALELLAWVQVVEANELHLHSDFRKLSASGRIRILLQGLGIPCGIPTYFSDLAKLVNRERPDGPGVVTWIRNSLVHENEKKRKAEARADAPQLYQCGQLAIGYVELCLLAVCGYNGFYARRGWSGWKGDDEVLVPWS